MSNALSQALWLTVIGMGMTFLSIGALVGGIYLLIHLTRTKEKTPKALVAEPAQTVAEVLRPTPPDWESQDAERRRRAVAAASAVAMVLTMDGRGVSAAPATVAQAELPVAEAWNAYARGLRLSSRSRYESRRCSH